MTTDQWLEVIFKLFIFDHAVLVTFITIKFILWISPKWWTKDV